VPSQERWRICADTGGTFTDCLAVDPSGRAHRAKVLSSGALRASVAETAGSARLRLVAEWVRTPAFAPGAELRAPSRGRGARIISLDETGWCTLGAPLPEVTPGDSVELSTGEEAPVLAARVVTGTPAGSPLPPMELRLATTRGTNALLERRGAPTAFFVTEGFADLLVIGDQTRPDLFTLEVRKPLPLHRAAIEVCERIDAAGRVVAPLDVPRLRRDARAAVADGLRFAAVALVHSWRNPSHEEVVRRELLAAGFEHVSISSALGASIGFLARAETAVVNAFLAPVIERYLDGVQRSLARGSTLRVMTSAGGLADRAAFAPKDSLLSGPAGGVVGAAGAARNAGFSRVISFDMGGTSTDCARCDGPPQRVYQTRVGDARIVAPCVAVETVAAGGGSICRADRAELRVGPESAGADPGPACYGRGGPLTLTDCNLLLGRLDPTRFAVPLDRAAAAARAEQALAAANDSRAGPITLEQMLAGFIAIADQRMSEAVRRITIRQGHDPEEHALVAFGGAGPQHACAIADALGIDTVVVPPDAGLLSAYGLSISRLERIAQRQALRPLSEALPELPALLEELAAEARRELGPSDPLHDTGTTTALAADLRFLGQEDILELDASDPGTLQPAFFSRYRATFGYVPADHPLELVAVRAAASRDDSTRRDPAPAPEAETVPVGGVSRAYLPSGDWCDARVRDRSSLGADQQVEGPALLTEAHSTTFVDAGWRATASPSGAMVLSRVRPRAGAARGPGVVEVELAAGKLGAIAMEMGERLRRTALSVNVKDRHDFSCALLDSEGRLVVNAPHVPVHLGSMGVCVRAVRARLGPRLGGTVVTNHPAFGGSHLPDVTVVHPALAPDGSLLGYAACRAHHAEIGGILPGSMAPNGANLAQEGVVIAPTVIGDESGVDWGRVRTLFEAGPFPSRSRATNVRDLAAAVHAAWAGAAAMRTLAGAIGAPAFAALGATILARASARMRTAFRELGDGVWRHEDRLDDGTPLRVSVTVLGDRAIVDFAGSGPVHPRCLNATPAIVTSAVVYVMRVLLREPLPLNEGLLEPVEIRLPAGFLNPPFHDDPSACPAVAGGNVEVSQLVVESILSALRLCAQSQGTMNNVVFGSSEFGFYETLAGGAGAGPGFDGESAVHSHMTNTKLSDIEVLEFRYPVRLRMCRVRRGSGAEGLHRGGDGMERVYEFLSDVDASVLAERRIVAPRGLHSGGQGLVGAQHVLRAGGSAPFTSGRIRAGECLQVLTPGGGGWGARHMAVELSEKRDAHRQTPDKT